MYLYVPVSCKADISLIAEVGNGIYCLFWVTKGQSRQCRLHDMAARLRSLGPPWQHFGVAHLQCVVSIIKVDYVGHWPHFLKHGLELFLHTLCVCFEPSIGGNEFAVVLLFVLPAESGFVALFCFAMSYLLDFEYLLFERSNSLYIFQPALSSAVLCHLPDLVFHSTMALGSSISASDNERNSCLIAPFAFQVLLAVHLIVGTVRSYPRTQRVTSSRSLASGNACFITSDVIPSIRSRWNLL